MRRVFVLMVISLLPVAAGAAGPAEEIDEILSIYHADRRFDGAVLVADEGEVLYQKGFGLANREWNLPNATDTRFAVGSVAKMFTATLVLRLVEDGDLELDDTIVAHLPDYRADTGERVTIHHLLSHTSGLPPFWTRDFHHEHARNNFDRGEFVQRFCSGDLLFEPGTDSQYSDTNYYLLGRIVESVAGRPFGMVLEERLFAPLGMAHSGYDSQAKVVPNRASGYIRTSTGYRRRPFNNRENADAAGATYTSVEDLLRLDVALYDDRYLSPRYREMLFESHASGQSGRESLDFGYGWYMGTMPLGTSDDVVRFAHAGGNDAGFTAVVYRFPDQQHLITVLTNAGPDWFNETLHEIVRKIVAVLHDAPYELPARSIAEGVASAVVSDGIEAARQRFSELRKRAGWALDERELNLVGYGLLRDGRLQEAVAVFRMNADAHPASANAWDSLAEGCLASGREDLAVEHYEKSLALDPENSNAKRMLKRLGAPGR